MGRGQGSLLAQGRKQRPSACVLRAEPPPAVVTGGTDILSCFMGQNPSLPVHKGEIQARNLAMAVEAWDEEGTSPPCLCSPV